MTHLTNIKDIEQTIAENILCLFYIKAPDCGVCNVMLGMVNQHKDLLKPYDQCIGGGYFHFDYTSNRIILDRSSYDFGKPKWHLLEVLKVPSVYRGLRLVYKYEITSTMTSM